MNVFVSHAISIGFAVVILVSLVFSLNSLSTQWSDFLGEYEPKHVCLSLRNSVETLYQESNASSVLGKLYVTLPKKAGSDYGIEFIGNKIAVESIKSNYTCFVHDYINLEGKTTSTNFYLELSSPNKVLIKDV